MTPEKHTSQAESTEVKGPSKLREILKTVGLALGLTVGANVLGAAAGDRADQIDREKQAFDLTRAKVTQVVDLNDAEK